MKRTIVTVRVCKTEQFDSDFPPCGLNDFLVWLNAQIALIPHEYRDTARIELDVTRSYEDSAYASIEISFTRPETDEEIAARIGMETAIRRNQEAQERAQLARLKAKYGEQA